MFAADEQLCIKTEHKAGAGRKTLSTSAHGSLRTNDFDCLIPTLWIIQGVFLCPEEFWEFVCKLRHPGIIAQTKKTNMQQKKEKATL